LQVAVEAQLISISFPSVSPVQSASQTALLEQLSLAFLQACLPEQVWLQFAPEQKNCASSQALKPLHTQSHVCPEPHRSSVLLHTPVPEQVSRQDKPAGQTKSTSLQPPLQSN